MRGESAGGFLSVARRPRGMAAAIASLRSSDEGNKSKRTRKQPDHDEGTAGWLHALLLALLAGAITIAVFLPASRGGFVWDDGGLIIKRHDTLDEWSDARRRSAARRPREKASSYYRPIMIATFVSTRSSSRLRGDLVPPHERHAAWLNVGLIVLTLVAYGCGLWAARIGALLFGLHPLQCQAVALILGRNDLLLVLPSRRCCSPTRSCAGAVGRDGRRRSWRSASRSRSGRRRPASSLRSSWCFSTCGGGEAVRRAPLAPTALRGARGRHRALLRDPRRGHRSAIDNGYYGYIPLLERPPSPAASSVTTSATWYCRGDSRRRPTIRASSILPPSTSGSRPRSSSRIVVATQLALRCNRRGRRSLDLRVVPGTGACPRGSDESADPRAPHVLAAFRDRVGVAAVRHVRRLRRSAARPPSSCSPSSPPSPSATLAIVREETSALADRPSKLRPRRTTPATTTGPP